MDHSFSPTIRAVISRTLGPGSEVALKVSPLLQYLNIKTRSAGRGSKSRSSFANLYAIYVLVEDYVAGGFGTSNKYQSYRGAKFSDLLTRQRQLPFGDKLQNHALNHRLNEEFKKYFPAEAHQPVLRDAQTNRYWINEHLLAVQIDGRPLNIATAVIAIVDAYVETKQESFNRFIEDCERIRAIQGTAPEEASAFVVDLLRPNVDARVFEIASYAILRSHYAGQSIYWGWSPDDVEEASLRLFKTGRTNANDGGIDFVMRPLGRFFQVTETIDVKKYFLDIDKVQRYPITFVVKSEESPEAIRERLRHQANELYGVDSIVRKYMDAVEEIINIPRLVQILKALADTGRLAEVTSDLVVQSRVEFNLKEK